jgi:hypothetical protein
MAQNVSAPEAPVRRAQEKGGDFAQSRQFEWLARAGIATRGVIYAIIGILAIKLAFGSGGETTNQQGALTEIAKQPFGKALLIFTAIGLAGYAIWRLVRAAIGHGPEASDDTKERIDGLASGIGYLLLFITAVSILIGSGGGGSGGPDKATGGVLGWPGGQFLVGIAGLVIIGVGLQQGYKGITRSFMEETDTHSMNDRVKHGYTAFGIFGHLARMAVFGLIGWFLVKAAIDYKPKEAVALDGALAKLAHAPYGPLLLGIVAAGLIGFGAFSLVESRYRRV